jgi:GGDEF domain-containing protein
MLGRQREAGGAPLASLGPQEIQAAGAAAAPPEPEIPLPGLSAAAPLVTSVAQATPGLVAGMARMVPDTLQRVRRGLVDELADQTGMTPPQRAAMHEVTKLAAAAPPFFAPDFQADLLRKADDAIVRPIERAIGNTETSQRLAAKRKNQSVGEALKDPERWQDWAGSSIPSMATMAAVNALAPGAGLLASTTLMEGGSKVREIEDKERQTGKRYNDLGAAAVAVATGVVNGYLEKFGFETAVGKLAEFLPAKARNGFLGAISRAVQGAVGEMGTEGLQQVIPNALTKALLDSTQDISEGVFDSMMGGLVGGGGMAMVNTGQRAVRGSEIEQRRSDRRAWRAEDGPGTPAAPAPFAEGGPGRGAVPQADLDAINEGVRSLEQPLSPSQKLERLKLQSAALDAQLRRLQSEMGHPTNDPSMQAPQPAAPLEQPLAPQPAHRPISIDTLLGAQALRGVVKATDFRDQTADARGRNVLNAVNAEERQRIAEAPGAALRMILGDDPAFAMAPAPVAAPADSFAAPLETTSADPSEKRMASTPVLDWLDTRSQEADEDRRTLPPEEWSHDEARYFALTDPATGLPNRAAVAIAERQSPNATRGTLDLDGLKAFNDTYGHEAGDEYIGMVPLYARQHGIRLFRLGGDEFGVLHDGTEEELGGMLEKAREAVEGARVPGATEAGEAYPLHKGWSHGTGRDFRTADARAYEDKRRRKAERPASNPQPVEVGGSTGAEAPAGPGDSPGVPPPLRRPGGDDSGNSGAPPAGPASLPPPVTPAAPAAAARAETSPAAPPAPAPAPNPAPTTEAFTRKGKTGEAFTADGERVGTQWAIADAFDDLVPSHTENGVGDLEPNPAFAQVLQPRNRERVASQDQIGEMAKNIRPGALGESFNASDGAPIVGPDRLVESGNGRTLALRRAFRTGKGEAYRAWLEEHAADFGLTSEDVRAVKNPVLVRVRITPTSDRAELVKKFNVATVATMSASETAAADADRLTPAMLAGFEPGADGNAILAVRNRGFVEKFFSSVPANERGRLIDSEGQLSQDGVRRIQAALMAKAYGSSPVLERLAESTDDNIKSVSTALLNAAPGMAAVKAGIAKGDILPLDPTPGIIEAAEKLSHLRETKTTVADFLDQTGLFGDDMSPAGKEFLRTFEEYKRSGKKLSEVLTFLSESLITEGGAKQETLFDDSPAPRLEDFIRAARRTVSDRGQVSLFGGEADLRTDGPKGDRPGPLPPGGRSGPVDKPRVSLTQGRKSTPPTPRHVMLIERFARSLAASWKDAPKIVVVSTEAELPEAIRERAESFDATGGVDGVYMGAKDDRVFLVASRLNSREDVERVILHEVMGHAGLRRILDRATFNSVMDQIAESLPKDVEAKAREYGLNLKDVGERREAADEVLAEWASRPEAAPRAITRAMVAIRGWLRQHFPNLKWTEADVRSLLAKARTRIENGADGEVVDGPARFSRATGEPTPLVTIRRMVADAKKTSSWKDWYTRHKSVIDELFGEDAPVFRRILAATSQAASVGANVGLAVKAYEQYMRGDPFVGYLPAVRANLDRIRAQERLEGPKITAYETAGSHKSGASQGAPVDRHVARYIFGVDTPSAGQTAMAQRMMATAAERLGWTPRQTQAALWAFKILADASERGAKVEVKSYADFLEAKADRIREFRRGFAGQSGEEGRGVPAGRETAPGDEGQVQRAHASEEVDPAETGGSGPRFSRKAQEPTKTLVALHNTNAEGIRAMERLGGVPIPSIGVTKPGISFDSYGSVTLIGDRSLVDPKRDSRNRVFESDIWSPRQPLPSRKFDRKAFTRFGDKVNDLLGNPKEWAQRFDPNAMDPPRDEGGFDRLIETFDRSGYNSFHVQRAYLLSRGTDVPLVMREENGRREVNYGETREALDAAIEPHREDFRKWLAAELEPVFGPEHLAAGRKRLPYTLENLVDVMRKMGLRGSEQSMFESLGKQKAKSSRELRSVEAMHRAERNLTSEFDMEQAKEAMSLDFHAFADELGKNRLFSGPFARLDEASASLGDAMKRGLSPETLKRALMERGFPEPSAETLDAGVEVARSIQQAPTQYFEAKPQRGVRLTEFRGAVIPEDSPADVRGILERAGLDVRTYKSGDADSRREAVESLSAERDLRFSRTSSSAEDRIYDSMMARARARATAAAEATKRVQAELEDPGDVMEARRDPNLPAHSNEIQNHIRPYGPRETVKGLLNPVETLYQQLIRRHFAVEKAGGAMGTDKGPAHRDPGVVAELAAGHSARAEQMIAGSGGFRNGADGNIEWTGNRSLESVLGDLGPGRLNELRRYLVARRAIELHHRTPPQQELGATQERTIYSGITEAAAQQEVAGAPQDIKAAAEQVTALLDDALRYWADAGGLSPAAVDVIRDMNRAYVPFYRIFEGKEPQKQGRLVLPAKRGVALQSEQAVKTIFGSQRDILDPLVAVADHIQRMIRAADLNRVGKTLVEAAALNPEGAFGLVEEVSSGRGTAEGVTNEGKALQDAAINFGVEVDDEAASALSFLSDKKLSYADDRIKVWQGGKLKEYRVAREIGESLRALGPEEATFFSKAVTFPAQLLRAGVTKNPIFQLHNFLRDTADASVQTRNGFVPVLDSIRGFKEALRDGSLRREWLAAGGGFATISGGGLKGAEKTIREIAPRTRTQSVLRTVIHPLDALSIFGRPFEEAARLGEFRKARLAGKTDTEAALDAARVTTNFTVHGADAKFWWLAKASAFTNPAIQGADKAFRTILEAPRGETQSAGRIGRAAAAVAVRGLLNVSLLSAVLYALNYDDKEIEELRKTKSGAVWWFMRVPGTQVILRFPKPFLWGQMFGTGMESMADKARGTDPDAMKRWRDEVLEMLTDNVFPIPTPFKEFNAQTFNFDPFFKRPIVPRGLEGAEPEMQVQPRTGETARQLGRAINYSPAKIEHAVGGLGGTLSREALKLSDSFLRDPGSSPPERHLSELPLVGRAFATGGTTGTYSIERFWREMDAVRTAKTTLREKMKSDPKGARLYAKEKATQLQAFSTYESTSERLGDLRKSIEAVRKAPDSRFAPAEKTRRIDALQARMNDLAKRTIERNLLEEKRP